MRSVVGLLLLGACALPRQPTDFARLSGVWESPGGFDYSVVTLDANGNVAWESGGCLDHASGRTSGRMLDGKLVLAEPIEEYGVGEVRELRYVRSGGREYLVANWALEIARDEREPFGQDFWWGLRRRLPRATLIARIAECVDSEERWALMREFACWPVDHDGVAFLERIACTDPDEYVRDTAEAALERAGLDEHDQVQDRTVRSAADAALQRVAVRDEQRAASP